MDLKQGAILAFIIVAIALVITLIKFDDIKYSFLESNQREFCRREVDINAISTSLQSRISCPVLAVTIKTDPNSKETKKRVANLMADARYVYDAAWQNSELFGAQNGVFCAVYGVIDFKQKNKYVEDFDQYLIETPSSLGEKNGQSYMDYLTNSKSSLAMSEAQGHPTLLSTNERYAVLFQYTKDYGFIDTVTNKVGTLIEGSPDMSGVGTTGKLATAIGGGVVIGVVGTIGLIYIGIPLGVVSALGVFGLGSLGSATAIFASTYAGEDPKITAAILLVNYTTQDSLKAYGCEIFPVSMGTRPQ
jgi:hypothetical protein